MVPMISWKQYPFVKLLIPLCLGILSNIYVFPDINIGINLFLLTYLTIIGILLILSRFVTYKYRWFTGISISLYLYLSGFALISVSNDLNKSEHFSEITKEKAFYQAKITETVEIKQNSVKLITEIISCKTNNKWQNCIGKAVFYLEKNNKSSDLKYGDVIIIYTKLQPIQSPKNPYEFNYKQYLANKNIHYQAYLSNKYWTATNVNKGNFVKNFAINLRSKLLKIFETNGLTGREYAVISAILLGQTDKIDPELYKEYTGSGALHVLSVSGMHVGIIFLSLGLFLSFLDKIKKGKLIKAIILISIIWFYALLTGLSPSVIRASAMISFIIIGKALKRDSEAVNILSASVFVILCFNPFLLLEVGFQLSFLAVFGMILFYDVFYKLWSPQNKWIDKLWQVSCVSVSAQLITTPLSLYYFHQFPNYFFLTNIVVFIFAAIVMYTGIFVLIFSFIPFISNILAKILSWLILAMNECIGFIEDLPFSVSKNIRFDMIDSIFLFLLFVSVIYALLYRSKKLIFISLFSIISLQSKQLYQNFIKNNSKKLIVYSVPKSSAIELFYAEKQVLFTDSLLINDDKKIAFHIQNNRIMNGINTNFNFLISQNANNNIIIKAKNFIQFADKKIVIINQKEKYIELDDKIKVDYLILSKNQHIKIADLLKVFKPELLIFDSSNKEWQCNKWEKECSVLNLKFYNVLKNGSFELKL